jgi:hypothetical protein
VSAPPVWWCDGTGRILSDGIASDKRVFGAVVNLSDDVAPVLSVDRKDIISYREGDVERLLTEAVPALTSAQTDLVDFNWLCRLADSMLAPADLITLQLIEAGRTLTIGNTILDARITGCCPVDSYLLIGDRDRDNTPIDQDRLTAWRATALGFTSDISDEDPVRRYPADMVPAIPSDALLISSHVNGRAPWLNAADPVSLHHVISAMVKLRRSPAQIAERLKILGYQTPDVSCLPAEVTEEDVLLLREGADNAGDPLDPASPVSIGHLMVRSRSATSWSELRSYG